MNAPAPTLIDVTSIPCPYASEERVQVYASPFSGGDGECLPATFVRMAPLAEVAAAGFQTYLAFAMQGITAVAVLHIDHPRFWGDQYLALGWILPSGVDPKADTPMGGFEPGARVNPIGPDGKVENLGAPMIVRRAATFAERASGQEGAFDVLFETEAARAAGQDLPSRPMSLTYVMCEIPEGVAGYGEGLQVVPTEWLVRECDA